jgi:DNA-binding response OmpR family regulator
MDTTRKPKILYVEDDRTLAMLYGMRLEAEGFDVEHCDDGESAIKAAQVAAPDLILVDLMMPALDGFKLIDIFHKAAETSSAKIVVLSALSQPEDISKARELGTDEYLIKSQVTVDEIVDNIRRVLGAPTPPVTTGA